MRMLFIYNISTCAHYYQGFSTLVITFFFQEAYQAFSASINNINHHLKCRWVYVNNMLIHKLYYKADVKYIY